MGRPTSSLVKYRCHFRQSTYHAGPHHQGCFILLFHLHRLRQRRHVVAQDARQRLVSALALSRVDYCNSSLPGLPAVAFAPLQMVLNAATRYVADLRPRDHVSRKLGPFVDHFCTHYPLTFDL